MFKFGFNDPEKVERKRQAENEEKKQWLTSMEIKIKNNQVPKRLIDDNGECVRLIELDDKYVLRHVSEEIVTDLLRRRKDVDNSILKAELVQSDLITSVYEGGLKIWQCTYDLLEYIYVEDFIFKDKKVLDLGCGAGILGIFAYVNGASVYFQDYNIEVIKCITIPNVLLNAKDPEAAKTCRFYSGDWGSFLDVTASDFKTNDDKFDYILTSETIYNPENFDKLHSVFRKRLKKDGVVLIAAKTHYFGVGGGTREFEEVLNQAECFKYETCWKRPDGVQREILKLNFMTKEEKEAERPFEVAT